jgi:hypothetical protein
VSGRDNSRARQAVRRAREVRVAREEALAAREKAIEAVLVEYFKAAGEVDRIKHMAQVKADAVLAEATRSTATPWAAACAAVRRLRDLCENNAEVAGLCGLRLEDVRDMLAATRAGEEPPAGGAGEAARPVESQSAAAVSDEVADESGGGAGGPEVVRYEMP